MYVTVQRGHNHYTDRLLYCNRTDVENEQLVHGDVSQMLPYRSRICMINLWDNSETVPSYGTIGKRCLRALHPFTLCNSKSK
ncbi:hypothetical protein CMV_000527 [Castanea mollissima]|uniref:Uncharacterized protein n=1 Tax=Castanea mollissima TaxID=60419 RepID=A0A8J4S3L8_9ROSI|nr:hypothetical protein CMV_000527 [Castanea mollissima]